MTVATQICIIRYPGNGVQTLFNYNFHIPPGLNAVEVAISDTFGTFTALAPGAYSITGLGNHLGGTVTYPLTGPPLPAGRSLYIRRVAPFIQSTSVPNQAFLPHTVEDVADYVTELTQQLLEFVGRTVRGPPSEVLAPMVGAAARAGKMAGFDSTGAMIPVEGTIPGNIPITPFGAELITAADADAAKDILEISGPPVLPSTIYTPVGLVADSPAAAMANANILNALMAQVAANHGGYIYVPSGNFYVGASIDNKYCNVWMIGTSKAETTNAGSAPPLGTNFIATFAGVVLRHRTPYNVNSAQFWGGGFVHISVLGNGIATRLLEVDSILSGTYDLYLYEAVGDWCALFICGRAGVDLAECRGIQNANINLRIVQDGQSGFPAAAAVGGVIFSGSNNANCSYNWNIILDIVHKNNTAAYFQCADNNFITSMRAARAPGGTGAGLIMGGRTAAHSGVGGEANTFLNVATGAGIRILANEAGQPPGIFNRIMALDTANWPGFFPTSDVPGESLWYWDDTTGGGSSDWIDYTPTITAQTGVIGSYAIVSAKYSRRGHTISVNVNFQITAKGTAATRIKVGLPIPSPRNSIMLGANVSSGHILWATTVNSTTTDLAAFDGGSPYGADGDYYGISGSYNMV